MQQDRQQDRGYFGRLGFIMAAAGSAIGLGNIWKFPYITYANDGGSFVLIYLVAILAIGAPIMLAEILLGRHARKSPVGAFLMVAAQSGRSPHWRWVGWLGVASGFVILSYYSVVAGWTVYYFAECIGWSIGGFTSAEAEGLGSAFGAFLGNGALQISFHFLFMAATAGIVVLGVKGGIERVNKLLMPALFLILLVLCINATTWPGFSDAIGFLFHIGPITAAAVLEAVGHAFFTLSLGMGAMLTYGSYVSRNESIPRAGLTVCALDTLIALMACVTMFSIIFSVPEAERAATFTASATILFTTLPRMFYALPGGAFLAPVFYMLVAFAALSSTISLLEVVVAYFIDQRGWSRTKATVTVGGLIFLTGVPAALSLGSVPAFGNIAFGKGVFDWFDYLASNWMLPIGGFFIAVFVGWRLQPAFNKQELEAGHGSFGLFSMWGFALRWICPIAIPSIILHLLGVF